MELALHLEEQEALYLRVPTFWDDIEKRWIGAIKTPKTRKILTAHGKDSFQLQNAFNRELSQALESEIADEVFSMFKPMCYWKEIE